MTARDRLAASAGVTALAFAGFGAEAHAQTAEMSPAPVAASGSSADRVVYDRAYFSRYSVSNAEDMLRLIPGVPAILESRDDQQERGFGAGGARVLVNGRRFPGKANEVTANLRRIPAGNVERVELLSGSGVAVQSEGIVVNLVLLEGVSLAGAGAWEANLRFNEEGRVEADGLVSYNGAVGALSYSLGIERNVWSPPAMGGVRWSNRLRDTIYYYPDGKVLELRPQHWTREHDKWIYTGGATYDFAGGDRLSVNGFYQTLDIVEDDRTTFTRFSPLGAPILTADDVHKKTTPTRTTLELGAEHERRIGPGQFKALALMRRDTSPMEDVRDLFIGPRKIEISRSQVAEETGEDILRASYNWPLMEGQSLEVGGEAARNSLDHGLRVFFDLNADDRVEEVIIPVGDSQVEEIRGEVFVTHRWNPSDALSLETTLNYETSTITTNHPFAPERTLAFFKPRLDARYRPNSAVQYRLLVERTVSQLDFGLFVPTYDVVDNEIDAGNPGLSPEKTWVFELGYERRLPKDAGLIEARAFYNDITDHIDKVPLLDSHGALYSAEGNQPKATLYGAEIKASLRLDSIGVPDALLSVRALRQESEVLDPFTSKPRRLWNDRGYNYDISFRQDLTRWGLAYGLTYKRFGWAADYSDLFVREYFTVEPTLEAFMEKRLSSSTTLRIEVQNLTGSHEGKVRYLYAVSQADGVLRRSERWDEERDLRVAARLRGKF